MFSELVVVTEVRSLKMSDRFVALLVAVVMSVTGPRLAIGQAVDLRECLRPSPIHRMDTGDVRIAGTAQVADGASVRVRVTTSLGDTYETQVTASKQHFVLRFPNDFPNAGPLCPMLMYVDATSAEQFGGPDSIAKQCEIVLIVAGNERSQWPDLPQAFLDDFLDAAGHKDQDTVQWQTQRTLVNLFMHSRSAQLMHIGRADFDLAHDRDYRWFQQHASLYDFDHRDRDWSVPLGNRVARGYWQAVWDRWFNGSNDHPWDGNAENRSPENYRPYTFANDLADLLVLYRLRPTTERVPADNRQTLANDVTANLLGMQHTGDDNFALVEASGKQEHYTSGAFRYGMFETGEWLTEGKGWFANPAFRDFVRGGVFNGRSVWGLGESLKADPNGPHAAKIREAIPLALKFCLHDGIARGYTRRLKSGLPYWGQPGEHGYLLMGMLAAAEVTPDLPVTLDPDRPPTRLRELCIRSLDALAEAIKPDGFWSNYPNADAVSIIALADGVALYGDHEHAAHWRSVAMQAADLWIDLKPLASERQKPTPHFGMRKDGGTTFYLSANDRHPHISLYVGGHWIHALARLSDVTGEAKYRQRAEALLGYYCGDNPLRVRLLNELGAVNNRTTDSDNDGTEDQIGWDAYPESSAFVQIGLLHLLRLK